MENKVVAVVGMCGSGKSVVSKLFKNLGYAEIYFGNITMQILEKEGLEKNQTNEKRIREEIRLNHGKAAYAKLSIPAIDKELIGNNVVIDGLYSWSEYKLLKSKYGDKLVVLGVVVNSGIRKERLINRELRPLTYEETENRDIAEIENLEKGGPIARADYYILNNSTKEELVRQFDEFIEFLGE